MCVFLAMQGGTGESNVPKMYFFILQELITAFETTWILGLENPWN